MINATLLIVLGFIVLVAGGEFLVRGASRIAAIAGISPLVIGLTVVAYGTSAPELMVSTYATLGGKADIAVGNAVGSNLANLLVILGLCALIAPLVTSPQLVRRDVPIMIAASAALYWMGRDGLIRLGEGLLLLSGAIAYTVVSIVTSRREEAAASSARGDPPPSGGSAKSWVVSLLLVSGGLGALILGAQLLVDGAVAIAQELGVGDAIIALTIVAIGTSLPELATSAVATYRGERDIAVGNVIGSSTFNILVILGAAGIVAGDGLAVSPVMQRVDIPLALAVAVVTWPLLATNLRLERWEGVMLLSGYIAYVAYLVLVEIGSPRLAPFVVGLRWAALPLAGTLVLGSVGGWLWERRRRPA